MTKGKAKPAGSKSGQNGIAAVETFMSALDHPLKAEIKAVRKFIREVESGRSECVTWSAPSIFYKDDFATLKLRLPTSLQVIFHTGAKVKHRKIVIDDPDSLFKWATADRVVITFRNMKVVTSH